MQYITDGRSNQNTKNSIINMLFNLTKKNMMNISHLSITHAFLFTASFITYYQVHLMISFL